MTIIMSLFPFLQGLEICQTIDDKAAESVILLNLGVTCELTKQFDKAIEWHTLVSDCNQY